MAPQSPSAHNQQSPMSTNSDSTTSTMNPLRKFRIFGRFFRILKNGRSTSATSTTATTTPALRPNLTTPAGSKLSNHQRWTTLATLICLVVLFLYIATNSWPPLFTSLDRQHRILFEKLEHGHRATGAIHGASSSSKRLMPTILARPLKHTPESLKLIGINHLTEIIKTNLSQIGNTTISQMNERIVNTAPNCTQGTSWQSHRYETHQTRLKRLRWMCSVYGFYDRIFTYWNRSSNRRFSGHIEHKYCSTLHCPLLVDEQRRVITCFVQKVASTTIKQLFLKIVNQTNDEDHHQEKAQHQSTTVHNLTTFHQTANEQIFRVSPMYIHNVKNSHYFKSLFVRHPFVRLVSAFKDKAERGPEKEPYFYAKYWYPLMDRLNPSASSTTTTNQTTRNPASRITFRQFVDELLLKTDPYHYDEHWAPIWTRCEPCYMHYNFIGKLETSDNDFAMFKSRLDQSLINETVWENQNINFSNGTLSESDKSSNWNQEELATDQKQCQLTRMRYAETSRYLAQLEPKSIIELYRRYYLDFELFGYTLEELFDTGYY